MSENILVVEYEPRYTDRVRQALASQPFTTTFARDGEEAIKALDSEQPRLIVLSSVVPKISTTELIRAIRGRKPLQETPILLTVSGYSGKTPKADAQRVGASDILPKPYSESEFLGKVQAMLGIAASAGVLTSTEIFGDLLDDEKAAAAPAPAARNPMSKSNDVDKMLADTLAGVMPQKKSTMPGTTPRPNVPTPAPPPAAPSPTSPGSQARPKTQSGDYDRMLNDTLSGLEKSARKPSTPTSPGTTPAPKPAGPSAAPAAPDKKFNTEKLAAYVPDRVPVSQPVFTPAPVAAPKVEEEEPVDGIKFGQYLLVEKIATGGMAEVWKARMRGVEGFQKIVAIKKILPHLSDNQDFIEMFVDEAKLAAQLNHNNIIHIYDLGKIQTSYYIAMEYIDGYDLKTILKRAQERDNPMQVELALFIASKVAAALDYAHRKRDFDDRDLGLVHRDVSPQNVLISQEGDIKLCDFGIAKAASKASHTQAGALKGKLQYMSPEQAWGRAIDKRSDVFALAAVLFEMLTGRRLFTGDNELSILEQVREARVIAPSTINDEVTPEIDNIVLKALSKDPAHRYQSAGEMARDLDAILYSFRPTPTSADLAIYMHRMSSTEPLPPPEPEHIEPPRPVIAAVPAPAPAPYVAPPVAAPVAAAPVASAYEPMAMPVEERRPGKSPVALIAIVLVLLGAGAAAFMYFNGKGTPPSGPAAQTTSAATLQPVPGTLPGATATTGSIVPVTGTTATTQTIDPSAVDAEVQKRIAAERDRLQRQQQAAAAAAIAAGRPVPPPPAATPIIAQQQPAPIPTPVQTQTVAQPAPVQTQTVAPAPVPAQPDPEPAAPVVARAREGDLIPVGTEGLTPPKLVRKGSVPYPPVAKVQRVEGTVICNVLVDERGQVADVRILRGIARAPSLNDAAQQTMRRSTFQAATKDGVRVKSWISVPVDFKL